MIYLACISAIALGVLSGVLFFVLTKVEQERDKWTEERQILLNRIENPKYRPPLSPAEKTADLEKVKQLKEESEQFGLVGKIIA